MKRKVTLTTLSFVFSLQAFSQAPIIQWQKCLGGTSLDEAHEIQQTSDSGFIVVGNSWSSNGDVTGHHGSSSTSDIWLVKLDNTGNIQWQKSLGGSDHDRGYSVQETFDRGFIVAGFSRSSDGDVDSNYNYYDGWVFKTDSVGTIQWQSNLGGFNEEYTYSVKQTPDSGFVVAGSWGIYWIIRYDVNGNVLWQKFLGGSFGEDAFSISLTNTGGYVVAGRSFSNDGDVTGHHGSADYWVVRLDSAGNIIWQKSLGGSGWDEAHSVLQTNDGGFVVGGYSASIDGDITGHHGTSLDDYWVVKLDGSGNLQWQKSLGGTNNDDGYSIIQSADGNYVICGGAKSVNGDVTGNQGLYDYWTVKLDNNGNILWKKSIGGSNDENCYSIQQTIDGGYILAGGSQSSNGDVTGNHGAGDYWIVKLQADTLTTEISDNILTSSFSLSPNPATSEFKIQNAEFKIEKIEMYNVLGGKVFEKRLTSDVQRPTISVADFTPGIYFVKLINQQGSVTRKIIVQR